MEANEEDKKEKEQWRKKKERNKVKLSSQVTSQVWEPSKHKTTGFFSSQHEVFGVQCWCLYLVLVSCFWLSKCRLSICLLDLTSKSDAVCQVNSGGSNLHVEVKVFLWHPSGIRPRTTGSLWFKLNNCEWWRDDSELIQDEHMMQTQPCRGVERFLLSDSILLSSPGSVCVWTAASSGKEMLVVQPISGSMVSEMEGWWNDRGLMHDSGRSCEWNWSKDGG